MLHRPRIRVTLMRLAAFVYLAAAAGAANGGRREGAQPEPVNLAWPEPPLTARIRVVRTLADETDLGRETTFGEQFRHFVSGEKPTISRLYQPRDVAVSKDGQRIYVSDFGQQLVFLFDLEHKAITHIGKKDPFDRPFGLALDGDENLYVVEQLSRQVRVLDRDGNRVRTISHPSIVRPTDVAIDQERGRLYLCDPATKQSPEHTVKIFSLEGDSLGTLGKGKGDCEGCLYFPTFVAVGLKGEVYVSNTLSARIEVFGPDGEYLRTVGGRGTVFGMFDKPKGVALDSFGNLYVVDSGWSNVQIFNERGDVLLYFGGRGTYPGLLKNPAGICIDGQNRIYVADYLNYRVTVYELVNTKAEDSFLSPVNSSPVGGEEHGDSPASPDTQAGG